MGLDMYLSCNSPELAIRLEEKGLLEPVWGSIRRYGTIGYWRKANAVHNWFVECVQRGDDDCKIHNVEVSDLVALKKACDTVLDSVVTVASDDCYNGKRLTENGWERIPRHGRIIANPEVAEEVLPTASGFFFGNTEYDDEYLASLEYTSKLIGGILGELSNEGEEYEWEYHVPGANRWLVQFTYQASW